MAEEDQGVGGEQAPGAPQRSAFVGWSAGAAVFVAASVWLARDRFRIDGLYPDEANRALVLDAHSWSAFRAVAFTDYGYTALLRLWMGVADHHAALAVLPSIVVGASCAPLLAWWCRRAGLSWFVGFVAGMVLVCSNVESDHVGSLKQYVWVTFAVVVLMHVALSAAGAGVPAPSDASSGVASPGVAEGRGRSVLVVAGVAVGAVVCSVLTVVPVIAFLAAVAWWHRSNRREVAWLAAAGASVGLWFVLVQRPAMQSASANMDAIGRTVHLGDGLHALGDFVDRVRDLLYGLAPWSADLSRERLVGVALGLLALVGGAVLWRRARVGVPPWSSPPDGSGDRRAPASGAVLALAGAPIVLAMVGCLLGLVRLGSRADTYLYPGLAVLAAVGAEALLGPLFRRSRFGAPVLAALGVLVAAATVSQLPYPVVSPSYSALARRLDAVPPDVCIELSGINPVGFLWESRWPVTFERRVPGWLWIQGGFPDRCVRMPGSGDYFLSAPPSPPGACTIAVHPEGDRWAVVASPAGCTPLPA